MTFEPEDLISPEEEAEIQQNFARGHSNEVIEALQRAVIFMKANPEQVTPEMVDFMAEGIRIHSVWMKQNGIGLMQPDVDSGQ